MIFQANSETQTNVLFLFMILCLVFRSCPILCNPLDYIQPTRLLCPWDFSGKNAGVGCHFLLQGIFPTQQSNLGLLCLLRCRWILYSLSYPESPLFLYSVIINKLLKNGNLCFWICNSQINSYFYF